MNIIGQILLNSNLTIDNVLFVPNFKFNLLSVGKMIKAKSLVAEFTLTSCQFQDPSTKQIIVVGKGSHGLYKLKADYNKNVVATSVTSSVRNSSSSNTSEFHTSVEPVAHLLASTSVHNKCTDLHLFHSRLGLTSMSKLIYIDDCKGFTCKDFFCDTCILAKHHRLPFNKGISTTATLFELVHTDLWGSYKTPALNGARYFLTIVDYCSKATWTYLIHTKDQVASILEFFLAYAQNHFKVTPKFIRSDNST